MIMFFDVSTYDNQIFENSWLSRNIYICLTNAVAQWQSIYLACRRLGFNPHSGQTYVIKTGSDSSTAKLSATGVSVTGPRR